MKKSRVSQYSRLKFQSPPAKLEDPPAALDWSDYASQQVDAYLGWLESSLVEVRKLSAAVEHGLQSEVEEELLDELRRVADWKAAQWDEQRALAGLYGGVSPQVHSSAPLEVSPGKSLFDRISQFRTYAFWTHRPAAHATHPAALDLCRVDIDHGVEYPVFISQRQREFTSESDTPSHIWSLDLATNAARRLESVGCFRSRAQS